MSRSITGKIKFEANLVAQTPLSVGGAGSGEVDLELAVDGRGDLYIPGSSLMGPIRHWFMKTFPQDCKRNDVLEILGFQDPDDGNKGSASYLVVNDSKICLPPQATPEIRSGIQIRRDSGVTRDRFTRAILPRGTTIPLTLELDLTDQPASEDFQAMLRFLIEELSGDGLSLGGGKTRGLGKVKLQPESIKVHRYDFRSDSREDLFRWLSDAPVPLTDWKKMGLQSRIAKSPRQSICFELEWQPASPVMVKAMQDGSRADMMPLVGYVGNGKVAAVIPGSALKGVLRSHAAKILRTLIGPSAPSTHHDYPDPDHGLEMIADLFGDSERAGRVSVWDVYQKDNPVPRDKWIEEDLQSLDSSTVHQDHVAIDRFTGGAAEGALYSARPPRTDKAWEPIRIEIDFTRKVKHTSRAIEDKIASNEDVGEHNGRDDADDDAGNDFTDLCRDERDAEVALILLVLRDLQSGLVPIGFGTRRGMGDIRIMKVTVRNELDQQPKAAAVSSAFDAFPPGRLAELQKAWEKSARNGFKVTPTHSETKQEKTA